MVYRREAEAHPRINRVSNPYVTVEPLEAAPQPVEQLSKPSEAWRAAFIKQFEGLRSVRCSPSLFLSAS